MTAFLGAFETTYLPGHDVDVAETTGHATRWREDLAALRGLGVTGVRYPLRWHRIERQPGHYDWDETDEVLEHLRATGMRPVVDLVHHTSYPRWLEEGFADARFGPAYVAFAEHVARRYPWLEEYTLLNEPFATLFLAGHQSLWPPYGRGLAGFVRLLRSVLPAFVEASRLWSRLLPGARHVWVDTCEVHAGTPGAPAEHAVRCNDRRFAVLDLVLGHDLEPQHRPFLRDLYAAGGQPLFEDLLRDGAARIDVVGLDYYAHSEWWYDEAGGHAPSPQPVGFAALAQQYAERYRRPLLLSETNIRGFPSDRATWLRYMLSQYERAAAAGVPLAGFCWFPSVDSCDWDSLLARAARRVDPVGVWSIGAGQERVSTSMTRAFAAAVGGVAARDLPAYRLQAPAAHRVGAHLTLMEPADWIDPPGEELVAPGRRVPAVVPARRTA